MYDRSQQIAAQTYCNSHFLKQKSNAFNQSYQNCEWLIPVAHFGEGPGEPPPPPPQPPTQNMKSQKEEKPTEQARNKKKPGPLSLRSGSATCHKTETSRRNIYIAIFRTTLNVW